MTVQTTPASSLDAQQIGMLYQYTVEAYKTFEKFSSSLPNPLSATMFKQFAVDERDIRDLLEMKAAASGSGHGARATLAGDLRFGEILEGDMSYRESSEFLIARERTMARRIDELVKGAGSADRNILVWIAAVKRSHIVELERELTLIREDSDWWKREDAESRIVHGPQQ